MKITFDATVKQVLDMLRGAFDVILTRDGKPFVAFHCVDESVWIDRLIHDIEVRKPSESELNLKVISLASYGEIFLSMYENRTLPCEKIAATEIEYIDGDYGDSAELWIEVE